MKDTNKTLTTTTIRIKINKLTKICLKIKEAVNNFISDFMAPVFFQLLLWQFADSHLRRI